MPRSETRPGLCPCDAVVNVGATGDHVRLVARGRNACSTSTPDAEPFSRVSVVSAGLVLVQVLSLAAGQILWKVGIDQAGGFMTAGRSALDSLVELAKSPAFVIGSGLYLVATFVWFYLLARHDLGYIYPILSLTYVVTFIGGWLVLGEPLSSSGWRQ